MLIFLFPLIIYSTLCLFVVSSRIVRLITQNDSFYSNLKRYLPPSLSIPIFLLSVFCKTGNTISRARTKSVYYLKSYKVLTKLPTTSYNINPDPFRSAIRQVGKKKLSDFHNFGEETNRERN